MKALLRILAVDLAMRGFGYAVLEGPTRLIDWGVKETRENKQKRTLALIDHMIEHYQPDLIVAENCLEKGSRRCDRVKRLIGAFLGLASNKKIKTKSYSRSVAKKAFFNNGATKHQVAIAIAEHFPELAPWLPPFRKPWMSEDPRMSIFNAMSLALVYFKSNQG